MTLTFTTITRVARAQGAARASEEISQGRRFEPRTAPEIRLQLLSLALFMNQF